MSDGDSFLEGPDTNSPTHSSAIILHFTRVTPVPHLSGFAPAREEIVAAVSLPSPPTGKIALQHSFSEIGDTLYEGSVFLDGLPVCDNAWDHNEALVVLSLIHI